MNSNIPAKDALREAFASVNVTLNGEPAKICGFDNPFATVAQIPSGLSAIGPGPRSVASSTITVADSEASSSLPAIPTERG